MKTILHKAESRGQFDYGWLNTKHTYQFCEVLRSRPGRFGALRVLNDDIVQPGEGFGRHPPDNMEIISIPIHGKLLHRDSMGHEQILKTRRSSGDECRKRIVP
jgi:redox-sensitive bicupin YhaK (pirin superfamily)